MCRYRYDNNFILNKPDTMNVIVRAMFGTALSRAEVEKLSTEMAFGVDNFLPNAAMSGLPAWLPLPGARRYRQVRQNRVQLQATSGACFQRRKTASRSSRACGDTVASVSVPNRPIVCRICSR
jgi:hypothetical protein